MPVLCGAGWRVAIYLLILLLRFFERGVWRCFVSGLGFVVHIWRKFYDKATKHPFERSRVKSSDT